MTRYILIDAASGFIWGDSADLNGSIFDGSAADYAQALEASLGEDRREFDELGFNQGRRSGQAGYIAYAVPTSFPIVENGQDEETIAAVERDCAPLCFLAPQSAA